MAAADQGTCPPSSGTVPIRGHKMHYELRSRGPEVILCLCGAVGTDLVDYSQQLQYFGVQNESRYTIVVVDSLGYGLSRPPEREFPIYPDYFLKMDAIDAHELMKKLSFDKFSILGWCHGSVSAIIMAALFPESVKKLVVWGAKVYITKQVIEQLEKTRKVADWDECMRKVREQTYGASLQNVWSNVVDAMTAIYKERGNGDLCMTEIQQIVCPTMVLHGMKDGLCPHSHPIHVHQQLVKNGVTSTLVELPDGKHNLQLRNAAEFNNAYVDHILSS